jgi:hypothetical protein
MIRPILQLRQSQRIFYETLILMDDCIKKDGYGIVTEATRNDTVNKSCKFKQSRLK